MEVVDDVLGLTGVGHWLIFRLVHFGAGEDLALEELCFLFGEEALEFLIFAAVEVDSFSEGTHFFNPDGELHDPCFVVQLEGFHLLLLVLLLDFQLFLH